MRSKRNPSCVARVSHALALCAVAGALAPELRAQMPPAAVRVDAVQSERLQPRHFATGEVRAVQRSHVAGREAGLVLELPVRVGRRVEKGALIARLDDRLLRLERAELAADREVADAAIRERQAELGLARWRHQAFTALKSRGSSHEQEVQQALAEIAGSEAALSRAEKQLALLDARAATLEQRIADLRVSAPFSGVVAQRLAEEGEWLAAGSPLVELLSDAEMEAWIEVPEAMASALASGEAAIEVVLPALGLELVVRDYRTLPQVDARTRTFSLVVPLANEKSALKPGMSVRALVPTGELAEHLTVSLDAVLRNDVGLFVYVARSSGAGSPPIAAPVRVEKLFSHGARIAVQSGELRAGDLVVVEGNERLFPGSPLAPITEPAKGSR
ncbi:MAG: efflux RND transporter periplasmic adaptor subunit [Planctomycetes bacterium]|nr:efflux RND transporter periplasmic adaptor subunit [Planctomycetota bacterium]